MTKYDDIKHLKRPKIENREFMDMKDRAAQFSPFAALTGHEEAVRETGRITKEKIDLDQYTIDEINSKLIILRDKIKKKPKVEIQYFKSDLIKEGGKYLTYKGRVLKIDQYNKKLIMEKQTEISIKDIVDIKIRTLKTTI